MYNNILLIKSPLVISNIFIINMLMISKLNQINQQSNLITIQLLESINKKRLAVADQVLKGK